ncbi:MAG TPA: HesA/MoeB/ThiF family protein [Planctomycetota bacterium]|nr:HesA/MoeB/ThiF family protein [Planctomycetota bacterium]
MREPQDLSPEEKAVYEWQLDVPGFGEAGQRKLKAATVLVTRIGGVGGAAAYALAAAGVGRLVLAHAGNVRANDLNRQLLMTAAGVGSPRVASAERRLRELNPRLEIETVAENPSESNVERLVRGADLVVDAAPLFRERFLLNREVVRQRKPMVDAAMYDFEVQVTTIRPGKGPCLACLTPADPPGWTRRFPVFGAVAAVAGNLAAVEAIKVLSGIGEPLVGRLLVADLRDMSFRTVKVARHPHCPVCR